ncbi:MAG: hypothetical protein NT049_18650, partial [Planctomycetota bacterium]|nr:hypothetical protein [Planctomycetota bacterium]
YCVDGIGGTPTWTELAIVKDGKFNSKRGEADATVRGSARKLTKATMLEESIEFEIRWDTEDEGFQAFQDAYLDNEPIGIAYMDGEIDASGSEGLWADVAVLQFNRNEQSEQMVTASIIVKPTVSDNEAEWKVIGE